MHGKGELMELCIKATVSIPLYWLPWATYSYILHGGIHPNSLVWDHFAHVTCTVNTFLVGFQNQHE